MLYAIIVALVLVADQWLKYWVTVNITLSTGEAALIPGIVKLVNIRNKGAAFGFLSNAAIARWLLIGLSAAFVILVIVLLAKKVITSRFSAWCAVFAVAGAVGNCIDRALYGYVVDMFKLEFVNFAVFNVADIVLVLSCLLFIIFMFVGGKGSDEKAKPAKAKPEPKSAPEKPEKPKKEKPQRRAKKQREDSVASADSGTLELFERPDPEEEQLRIQADTDFWNTLKYATGKGSGVAPARPAGLQNVRPKTEPAPAPAVTCSGDDLDKLIDASIARILGETPKSGTASGQAPVAEAKPDEIPMQSLVDIPQVSRESKSPDGFDLNDILSEFKDI